MYDVYLMCYIVCKLQYYPNMISGGYHNNIHLKINNGLFLQSKDMINMFVQILSLAFLLTECFAGTTGMLKINSVSRSSEFYILCKEILMINIIISSCII